ncbi:MAG: hypothetical protein LBC95_01275 [Candidatus Nomurabacteria bacterium]|jgi:division/cell wall cluster transcriptional repressor MraZ|nr:hypothetical protein [Candidatus Nomurabacteria bacterium]
MENIVANTEKTPLTYIKIVNVDDKNRIIIPEVYRRYLDSTGESKLIFFKTSKNEFRLLPMGEWKKIADHLQELPMEDPEVRQKQFVFFGNSYDASMNKNGRAHVPHGINHGGKLEFKWDYYGDSDLRFPAFRNPVESDGSAQTTPIKAKSSPDGTDPSVLSVQR